LCQKNDRGDQKRQDTDTVVRERTNVTESVTEEIRRRRLSWFGHISRMEIDRLPSARELYCHVTGERSQGIRQAKQWMENTKDDFELRNIYNNLKMP